MSKKRSRRDDNSPMGSNERKIKNLKISEDDAVATLPPSSNNDGSLAPTIPRTNSNEAATVSANRVVISVNNNRQFYGSMARVNYSFYLWAKERQKNLHNRSPSDPPIGSSEHFAPNIDAVKQYLHEVGELKRRFSRAHGNVYVMGNGETGQLGCGEVTVARKPRLLKESSGLEFNQVACGGMHSLALDGKGQVISWGCDDEGSLGAVPISDGRLPCAVSGFHPSEFGPNRRDGGNEIVDAATGEVIPFEQRENANITMVAAGATQSLALSSTGDIYQWGNFKDESGRKCRNMPPEDDTRILTGRKDLTLLEDDDKASNYYPPKGTQDWPMHLVEIPLRAKDIACGERFNAALLEDDTLVTWGMDWVGESGRGLEPLEKPLEKKKSENDAGKSEEEIKQEEKERIKRLIPLYLKPASPLWAGPQIKRTVTMVSCGSFHLLAAVKDGCNGVRNVYSCGLNGDGQLGHGDCENKSALTKVESFVGQDIATVEGGFYHSYFLSIDRKELYACGGGQYGQLGCTLELPDRHYCELVPRRVPLVYEPKEPVEEPKKYSIIEENIDEDEQPEIAQVACGNYHVLVVTKDGDVYAWGFGSEGQCGHGKEDTEDEDGDFFRPKKLVVSLKDRTSALKAKYVSGGGHYSAMIATVNSAVQN